VEEWRPARWGAVRRLRTVRRGVQVLTAAQPGGANEKIPCLTDIIYDILLWFRYLGVLCIMLGDTKQ
jgi:hypothetical protein